MVITPRYSFVRINQDDEITTCGNSTELRCLPVNEISDIQFQVITDFEESPVPGTINKLVALPCEICSEHSDAEIYQYAFGKQKLEVTSSADDDGNLQVGLDENFADIQVGDFVFLTAGCNEADDHSYVGVYEVLEIDPVSFLYTLNTPFYGVFGEFCGTPYLINFPRGPHLLGDTSLEIEDNTEFAGDNYVWSLSEPFPTLPLPYAPSQCFKLCIYEVTVHVELPNVLPELVSVVCIGTTNCFVKTDDLCYTSKITYGCNESSFGFYGSPFVNSIRLPFFLKNPQFPGEEKGYQKSDGTFVKLAERINKQWELETDYLPEVWHERLRVALSCDSIEVTNENANLTDEGIYRNDGYEIEWIENMNHPLAKGKTKVMKRRLVASVNSNCNG